MTQSSEDLKKRLARPREIDISVTGRKSGATITLPVWFVLEGEKLYLLPVFGSETQWFKNFEKSRVLGISGRGWQANFKPAIMRDSEEVTAVTDKFRSKYGAADVKKYYKKFDVALRVDLEHPGSAVT